NFPDNKSILLEPKSSFKDLIQAELPVLVDFHATWCGPCQMLKPVLENLAISWRDKVRIIKIDVDKNPQVSSVYKVQGVPTLILFRKGNIVWRQSGFMNEHQLNSVLNKFV